MHELVDHVTLETAVGGGDTQRFLFKIRGFGSTKHGSKMLVFCCNQTVDLLFQTSPSEETLALDSVSRAP